MAIVYNKKEKERYEKVKKQRANPEDVKLFKYSVTAKASITLSQDTVSMQTEDFDISMGDDYGIIINGPVGYTNFWHKMKYGGTYRGNPMVHSNIPSTINTPVPLFVWDFPYENLKALYLNPIIKGILGGL